MPNKPTKTRMTVQCRMVIDGKPKKLGDSVSLDYTDPQVRGWVRAGNVRLVPAKTKGAS